MVKTAYEVKVTFEAFITVSADDETEAVELAMDKARADYGLEVYEWGRFRVVDPDSVSPCESCGSSAQGFFCAKCDDSAI